MDSNFKEASLDVPNSKPSVVTSSLPTSTATSADTGNSQSIVSRANLTKKPIIRKIIPLDPKKLQQAGLDRKIAEALSKQKSKQGIISQSPNQNVVLSSKQGISQTPKQNVVGLPSYLPQNQTAIGRNIAVSKPKLNSPGIFFLICT